jgi:hypothetical protein
VIAGDIPDIPSYVNVDSIHVHAPTQVVFVCGGEVDVKATTPKSLRDAFMRVSHLSTLSKYDVRLAEEMEVFFPKGEYVELLKFESDIAQISELILLFSESAGSLAELGVFVMDDEIAPRMLVVVDDKNYSKDSFVKLGPLYTLASHYGESTVCVLKLADLGIKDINNVKSVDVNALLAHLNDPLKVRLQKKEEPRTFDRHRNGHITKLVTGLIQYYGALTVDEIEVLLYCLEIPKSSQDIKRCLQCAELFNWIRRDKRGIEVYFAAVAIKSAISFDVISSAAPMNRVRWKSDVLDHWRRNDAQRFQSITAARLEAVA